MTSEDDAGVRTLPLDGVLDFLTAPDTQRRAVALITEPQVRRLVVDMAGLTFIDSSGLSLLVYLKGRCDERGVELAWGEVPARARTLINSLGLQAYFDLPPA